MTDDAKSLMQSLGDSPSYAVIQRVGRELLVLPDPDEAVSPASRVRIALASSFTIDPLAAALAVDCHRLGLWPSIHIVGYDQYKLHLLDGNSSLYGFKPDVVFLAAELGSLIPVDDDSMADERIVEHASSQVIQLVQAFKRLSQALLVVFNFVEPVRFPFSISGGHLRTLQGAVNETLERELAGDAQVRILGFDKLCAYHGKERVTSPKMHYMGHIEISDAFLPMVSRQCAAYIRALKGLTRKCLVLDLDGVLWGGTVGEDGMEGIRLQRTGNGSEYYEFQQAILRLFKRGVVLAINSKNNPDDAQQVIREHPDMVLREEHFASTQINWNDKASNMQVIARELNLGLDSIVFLDDSPTERAWVRHALPQVTAYDLPADAVDYARFLRELTDFEVLVLTEEDRQRGAMYATDRVRRELRVSAASAEDFLKSLKMEMTIGYASNMDVPRIGQLTRKTNQFNLTTRRYSDAEITAMADASDVTVHTLSVQDIFGDSGLVGVAILRRREEGRSLDTFLMSCRVLGRGIEKAFLYEVMNNTKKSGVKEIMGYYVPSSKNGLAADFLRDCGFHHVRGDGNGGTTWRLDLGSLTYRRPPRYRVRWQDEGVSSSAESAGS